MVERERRRWVGLVMEGALEGYRIEVRGQRLPWMLYVLSLTSPREEEPVIGFAEGRQRLARSRQMVDRLA